MKPAAAPTLLAILSAAAPSRLVRKLDQEPRKAESWSWWHEGDVTTVVTDGGDRVLLKARDGVVSSLEEVSCSCLLSPRCFHLLAAVSALPIAEATREMVAMQTIEAGPATAIAGVAKSASAAPLAISSEQRTAARECFAALAELISTGSLAAGVVLQGELLRALHSSRSARLPRLSSAILRCLQSVRDCRSESPSFSLPIFSQALAEALLCAHVLRDDRLPANLHLGVARREYSDAGSLRLYGVFSEPVLTATGYAGVVTHLVDSQGALFNSGDVLPGKADRIPGAYSGAARLGGGALTHRALSREGLFVNGATASPDGRLGAGGSVQAVRASGVDWSSEPIAALFKTPIASQLERIYQAFDRPETERPSGSDLLFFQARVKASAGDSLLLDAVPTPSSMADATAISLPLAASTSLDDSLPARDNLRALAGRAGIALRAIARVRPGGARQIELLACASVDAPGFSLPAEWSGRINFALDRIESSFLPSRSQDAAPAIFPARAPPGIDPLTAWRRRLDRLAYGGRNTLFTAASGPIDREARALESQMMPIAAKLLQALSVAGPDRSSGHRERLALAFLAGSEYVRAASLQLERARWLSGL